MDNPIDTWIATALRSYVVVAVIALLVGATIAPYAVGVATSSGSENHVAVVKIDEPISDSTVTSVTQELRELRANASVDAVVLRVSSPGGAAAASEAQYLAVKRLAAEKPVYASVGGTAASGAFYTILPTNRIYATPGSIVGSVGVRGTAPSDGLTGEPTTGPDKAHGGMTAEEYYTSLETMKRGFVGAVMTERSDALEIDRETVATAATYTGSRAVEVGYADEIGGLEAAIAGAADEAGIDSYDVTYRDPASPSFGLLFAGAEDGEQTPRVEHPRFYMLYGTLPGESSNTTEVTA